LMAELQQPLAIEPGLRLKYSNHGFALLGLVIEAVTGEPYRAWITREIVDAIGLRETQPDTPLAKGALLAQGHTPRLPLERRLVVPGDTSAHAMASAAGFVSTAADTARFFAQLAPNAKRSVLSPASRREMTRPQWRNPHAAIESYYGLGTMSGKTAGWDWFGHTGGFHGYISRTAVIPACDLTISIFTNSTDGWAALWVDGAMQILRTFATRGAPQKQVRDWTGRLWTSWNAFDLVPMGDRVLVAVPQAINPFMDVAEIEVTGKPVRRVRSKTGKLTEVWLGGSKLRPEAAVAAELDRKYGAGKRRSAR
jgi:CubicO group peptidase (beta-lactamase class C family)